MNILKAIFSGGDLVKGITDIVGKAVKDKDLASKLAHEIEVLAKSHAQERLKLEVADRDSARRREIEVKRSGSKDIMMFISGLVGLGALGFILYALVYLDIPEANRDLFIHAIGIVEGVALSIFAYYFGSSKGSADKTKIYEKHR